MDNENIGMDRDELLRLKQISGLAELFADRNFTIPDEKEKYDFEKMSDYIDMGVLIYAICIL